MRELNHMEIEIVQEDVQLQIGECQPQFKTHVLNIFHVRSSDYIILLIRP